MAASAPGSDQLMNELNTTPLIDVMLVLLIMFIITIPMQSHSVPIDLPVGEPEVIIEKERNKLIVDRGGGLYWNGSALTTEALAATLQRVGAMPSQPELQLEPHAEARYERVDEVLALIKRANIGAMGMVGNERYARF
jgi:biopolymer transport protein ExbD